MTSVIVISLINLVLVIIFLIEFLPMGILALVFWLMSVGGAFGYARTKKEGFITLSNIGFLLFIPLSPLLTT